MRGSVFIGSPDTVVAKLKDLQRDIGLSGVQLETNCAGLADHAAEGVGFASDSLLEEDGFERPRLRRTAPSVVHPAAERQTAMSTRGSHQTRRWREMDSNHRYPAKFFWPPVDPRAIHLPQYKPAPSRQGPRVRIHLPPPASPRTLGPSRDEIRPGRQAAAQHSSKAEPDQANSLACHILPRRWVRVRKICGLRERVGRRWTLG